MENKNINNIAEDEIKFNKEAKEYVPQKLQQTQKENINTTNTNMDIQLKSHIDAQEYIPKMCEFHITTLEEDDGEENEEQFEDIIEDIMQQESMAELNAFDEEESDEDKWFPQFKDCYCCKGLIYKCDGEVCKNLGVCFCKAKEDYDDEA